MHSPPPDPPVSDNVPSDAILTKYDQQQLVTYLRLLDAEAEGSIGAVARIVLHIDPEREPKPGKTGVAEPSRPRALDDESWLPASTSGRRMN